MSEAVFSVHRERIRYITQTVKEVSSLCTNGTLLIRILHMYEGLTREAFVGAAGHSSLAFTVWPFGMRVHFSHWPRRLLRRSPLSSITPTLSFFRSCRSVILAAGSIACYTSGKSGLHLGLRLPTATVKGSPTCNARVIPRLVNGTLFFKGMATGLCTPSQWGE